MHQMSAKTAVIALFLLSGATIGVWAARIPSITQKLDIGPDTLGVLLLMMAAGAILMFPLAGSLSDRFGAPKVAIISAGLLMLTLILVGASPTLLTIGIAIILFGAANGVIDVSMNAWAAKVEGELSRPIMSMFHAMYSLGAGVGAAIGGFAVKADMPLSVNFALLSVILLPPVLWITRVGWQPHTPEHHSKRRLLALPSGALWLVGLIALFSSIGEGGMTDWSALFMIEVTGASKPQAAIGYTVFAVTMFVVRMLGDRIIMRFGPVATVRASGVIATFGTILAILGLSIPVALAGFALMGIGFAVIVPIAFSRAAATKGMGTGSAIASVATLGYGGQLLGPPALGFLAAAGSFQMAFSVIAVLAVGIVILAGAVQATHD